MKAVVVASGELDADDLRHLDDAELIVAADGGAIPLRAAGCRIDLLVGDLDSADATLVEQLGAAGTRIERHPADKEASDTELAVRAALAHGATRLVLLGVTGKRRLDHELANLLLLADPALDGLDARIVHGPTTVRVAGGGGRLELEAGAGDLVTLLSIGGNADGVSTTGLRWALDDATLRMGGSRGLSNEVVAPGASVRVEHGTLLVVETIGQDKE